MILSIHQITHHQALNAIIPKPGTLPLLNDSSVTLSDPSLRIEVFATGLKNPTNMAFLNNGDVLVLEKQNGTVRKIVNGSVLPEPLLDVDVANYDTRGMLGIAIAKNETGGKDQIFLYYTEAKEGKTEERTDVLALISASKDTCRKEICYINTNYHKMDQN